MKQKGATMKIKTSLYIDKFIWREIKKSAIDAGQTIGEFITRLFLARRCENDGKPTDQAGRAENGRR
jgi:hypothetical protein